jgi:hypothetical protein
MSPEVVTLSPKVPFIQSLSIGSENTQFRITVATNFRALTCFLNGYYAVGHEREKNLCYSLSYVTCQCLTYLDLDMWRVVSIHQGTSLSLWRSGRFPSFAKHVRIKCSHITLLWNCVDSIVYLIRQQYAYTHGVIHISMNTLIDIWENFVHIYLLLISRVLSERIIWVYMVRLRTSCH